MVDALVRGIARGWSAAGLAENLEVVLRDAAGREHMIAAPPHSAGRQVFPHDRRLEVVTIEVTAGGVVVEFCDGLSTREGLRRLTVPVDDVTWF